MYSTLVRYGSNKGNSGSVECGEKICHRKAKAQSTTSPKDRHDDLKSDVSTETKQSIKKIKSHKKLILSEPVTIDI
jgi:hypothetical protein